MRLVSRPGGPSGQQKKFNVQTRQHTVFDVAIISHFAARLQEDISKVILQTADAPNTVNDMLEAAEAVEAEQAKIGSPGASTLVVQEMYPSLPGPFDGPH